MRFHGDQLAYCTNIHPAETWVETEHMLQTHVLPVRDRLREQGSLGADEPFAIGLRLSAVAARELLHGARLAGFRDWLSATNTYVFTINGFPYGSFHGTRVKEKVFQPDWTEPERLDYTKGTYAKLLAFEALLEAHPELVGKVSLITICVPAAREMTIYDELISQIEQAVGRTAVLDNQVGDTVLRAGRRCAGPGVVRADGLASR